MIELRTKAVGLGIWFLFAFQKSLPAQSAGKVEYEIIKKSTNSPHIPNVSIPIRNLRDIARMIVVYEGGKAMRYFETDIVPFSKEYVPVKYSFIVADSGYYFIEDPYNDKLYKCPFPNVSLGSTGRHRSFLSIDCDEFFSSVNGDTSFYYLTKKLPKAAGLTQFVGVESCVLGVTDKNISIFPAGISLDRGELLPLPSKPIQIINSINSNLVWGSQGSLSKGRTFPEFVAKDILGNQVSNTDFRANDHSVLLFWDKIRSSKFAPAKEIEYDKYYSDQIEEILIALDSLCRLRQLRLFAFSTEYLENIAKPDYTFVSRLQCGHFVTNAEQWQGLLNITADPLIIFVNRKGVISEILTPFDFPQDKLLDFFAQTIPNGTK